MTEQPHLRISTWKVQALAWVGATFFTFCTVMSWLSGQTNVSPWFIPFILLSVPVLLLTGPITASPDILRHTTPLGRFVIPWREIERIEHGQSSIVFFSGQRRMSIPTPNWWSGPDKQTLLAAIESLMRERQIEMKKTFRADYLFPKHTKVG
jgi:hypothetical protein